MARLRSPRILASQMQYADIVSSGSTLFKNNLKEVAKILDSEAVLVQTPKINAEKGMD